jgi:hypothetical protein
MIYRKLFVALFTFALVAPTAVFAKKIDMDPDLTASNCRGKKCSMSRTSQKDIFTAENIAIQLGEDEDIRDFIGSARSKRSGKKQRQWYGEADGRFTMNLIEDEEGNMAGSINEGDTIYHIEIGADGSQYVTATATSEFAPERDPLLHAVPEHLDDEEDNIFVQESIRKLSTHSSGLRGSFLDAITSQRALQASAPNSTLDVMVVWTRQAECEKAETGSGLCTNLDETTRTSMESLVDLAVFETNVAFEESGIYAELNLVHAFRDETYTEPTTGDVFDTALRDFTGTTDGEMDYIHALRDAHCADIVVLLVGNTEYCGIGWLPGNPVYVSMC